MTSMSDPVTDDTVAIAVTLTITAHRGTLDDDPEQWRPGTCSQCQADGSCPQMVWALGEQRNARARAARPARTTPTSPTGGIPTAGQSEGDTR